MALPVRKIETMRPVAAAVEEISQLFLETLPVVGH